MSDSASNTRRSGVSLAQVNGVPQVGRSLRIAAAVNLILAIAALPLSNAYGQAAPSQANAEVATLTNQFGLPVVQIPATTGRYTLTAAQSLTQAALPNATIQANAPELGVVPAFPPDQQDDVATPPYLSNNLHNFRFDSFNNLFLFGGSHTWSTEDYAAVHGFNALGGYNRNGSNDNWEPAGTQWMSAVTGLDLDVMMSTLHLGFRRWDQLMDVAEPQIIQAMVAQKAFPSDPTQTDQLQIDYELLVIDPPTLRQQSWYPSGASAEDKAAFEKKFYDGYALSQYAGADAARQLGFKNISIYAWNPLYVGWFGLDTYAVDPATDWYWQSVGVQIIKHVDIVNPSEYCFYRDFGNVAYTLAQSDINLALVNSLPVEQRKPVRPYFWNQLHGGGGGWRWWANQALETEEMRAIGFLNAFTQYDGMVLWNWSGSGNDNIPPPVTIAADVMFKDNTFTAAQEGGGTRTFSRYEAVHISSTDSNGNIQFQLLNLDTGNNYGVGPTFPRYDSTVAALTPHLRAPSEPLAPLFEGLAMAKLVEWNLRNGQQVVDFDPQATFGQRLPIVRHVKNGDLHILATYDPEVAYGLPARNVTVNDFNGVSGLSLTLPADDQVRLYAVRMPAALVGRWQFNEDRGPSTADSSGHLNTGTLVNRPTWVTGQTKSALDFSGGTSSVAVNGAGSVANLYKSGMTLSAWIKPAGSGGGGGGRIVDKDNKNGGWFLKMASNNTLNFTSDQAYSGIPARTSAPGIVLNTWQHVAVTWDGGVLGQNIHIYINGVNADGASSDGALPNSSDADTPLTIGNRPVDNARGFDGAIDDVRIYNGVLTDAQIQAIANGS